MELEEIWKPLHIGNGEYEISNKGRIKRNGSFRFPSRWNKYKVIRIQTGSGYKTYYLHRLVAETFIDNPDNKHVVNHKDGNKMNNNANNLEWVTSRENNIHAWKSGYMEKVRTAVLPNLEKARKCIHTKKPVIQKSIDGNILAKWDSASDAMKKLGIDGSAISKCCRGKLRTTGGYKWEFCV